MPIATQSPYAQDNQGMSGWTLSELLISLALMAVLAAVALPAFNTQQRQARRTDAQSALQQLQLDQARWRGTHPGHASDLSSLGWDSDRSPSGHYRISIDNATAEGYTLSAIPVGSQSGDKACSPMRLQLTHTASTTLSSGDDVNSDPARCWRH